METIQIAVKLNQENKILYTVTECASMEENENKEKIWTITVFTETGIFSSKCQNGKVIERWELEYINPDGRKFKIFLISLK